MADSRPSGNVRPATRVGRRQFVHAVGAAGVAGAFGAAARPVAYTQTAGREQPAGTAPEFAAPATLRKGAQLDSRFPVSFAVPVSEGFRLVTEYFSALSQRNLEGISRDVALPVRSLREHRADRSRERAGLPLEPAAVTERDREGEEQDHPGSYDLLESMNVHLYCPIGGVFSLSFTRYTPDGHKLLACDGIYSVTNNDGRWAIQLASTIVHEVDFLGVGYPDAEAADIRRNQNYLGAFGYRNEAALNDPASSRGSYEPPLPVGTRVASVNFAYGPRERSRDAREGRPMDGWRTKGVKSRLQVSTVTEESRNRAITTNLAEFIELAGGAVGEYRLHARFPYRPILIHATHDKAHSLNGYLRYTADGRLISETRGVGIRIYKNGAWGSAGGLGQVTHHDRSNSRP